MLTIRGFALVTNILEIICKVKLILVPCTLKLKIMMNNRVLVIGLIFSTFMIGKILYTNTKVDKYLNSDTPKTLGNVVDSIVDSVVVVDVIRKPIRIDNRLVESFEGTNFDYVHPKFKVFNPNIDTTTTKFFVGVMSAYNLDITDYHRQMYTGQILLESGAKQYYDDGRLIVSSGGAIGFTQIIPSTCQWILQTYADSSDVEFMKSLGATDFTFVFNKGEVTSSKVVKCRTWLSNQVNNIIMWGFLTSNSLENKSGVDTQLVSYNMGNGGCRTYIREGGEVYNHHYVKGIMNKLAYAKSH